MDGNIVLKVNGRRKEKMNEMMRIGITWDWVSPFLKVISGIAEVHMVTDYGWKIIARFRVKCETNSIAYQSIDKEGIPRDVLDLIKSDLDCMINSYFRGMNLEEFTFHWIPKQFESNPEPDDSEDHPNYICKGAIFS